jgi:hypothetical protein
MNTDIDDSDCIVVQKGGGEVCLFVYSINVYMSLRLCKTSGYVAATFLALCSSSPSTLGFPPSTNEIKIVKV